MEEGYYIINNTKKILYWDGKEWKKPVKDSRGSYSGLLSRLQKQPKIKSIIAADENRFI